MGQGADGHREAGGLTRRRGRVDLAYTQARFTDYDPRGSNIPGAPSFVAAAGITLGEATGWFGGLRWRYFGPRPLIEDDSVRSDASATLSARVTCRLSSRYSLNVDAFNFTNAKASDVDYFYPSRLSGEPFEGIADVHTHPLEPRTLRASVTATF